MNLLTCSRPRGIGPLSLVFLTLLACSRPESGSPPLDSAASVDVVVGAGNTEPAIDSGTSTAAPAPAPSDERASARATPPAAATLPLPAGPPRRAAPANPAARVSRAAPDTAEVIAPMAGATPPPPEAPAESTAATLTTTASTAGVQSVPQPVSPVSPASAPPASAPAARRHLPFAPGERLVYDVRFGPLKVGTGTMEVSSIDTVRGREVFHTIFRIRGGTLFYKVNDRYESWFDTQSLASRRYRQDIDEGNYERRRAFEIFPERATFSEDGEKEQPSVTEPLDDGSFIYFVRSIPLEVGRTYEFHRYFRPDRNPVTIHVLRRERVRVPAGSFDAIVVRPVIKAKGIFSEGGRAELWLADDSTRVMLQLQSKLSFGSLNLYLTSITRP